MNSSKDTEVGTKSKVLVYRLIKELAVAFGFIGWTSTLLEDWYKIIAGVIIETW